MMRLASEKRERFVMLCEEAAKLGRDPFGGQDGVAHAALTEAAAIMEAAGYPGDTPVPTTTEEMREAIIWILRELYPIRTGPYGGHLRPLWERDGELFRAALASLKDDDTVETIGTGAMRLSGLVQEGAEKEVDHGK